MAVTITLPQLGLTMNEGTIVEWSKEPNEPIAKGETLFVCENDKNVVDVESSYEGTLAAILVDPGTEVKVGAAIAIIAEPGETVEAALAGSTVDARAETPGAETATGEAAPLTTVGAGAASGRATTADAVVERGGPRSRRLASPLARVLAEQHKLDISELAGSGPGGTVVKRDVMAAIEAGPTAETAATPALDTDAAYAGTIEQADIGRGGELEPEYRIETLTRPQQVGARRLAASWSEIPQFTLYRAIEVEPLLSLREDLRGDEGTVSMTVLLAKAISAALVDTPRLNAERVSETDVRVWRDVNVGIAMDTGDGLVVPVLKRCDSRGLRALTRDWSAMSERVRAGAPSAADYEGATVTLSNLGGFGIDRFRAIINPPQVAIISAGRIERRPVETADGGFRFASTIEFGITADHRVVDGAYAARFLERLARVITQPVLMYEAG